MKNITKALLFIAMLGTLAFTGCSKPTEEPVEAEVTEASEEEETEVEEATESGGEAKKLVIGSAPTTNATVEALIPSLEEMGYEVEVKFFQDYVQPNVALDEGQIDCNIIQHQPYLNAYNESNGTSLKWQGDVVLGFTNLYSNKHESIDALPDGAKIGMFSDPSNQDRTLKLLVDEGLLTVNDANGDGLYTLLEIEENKKNLDFITMDMTQLSASLGDTDASFMPALNIVLSGVAPDYQIATETVNNTSRNFSLGLVVKEENDGADFAKDILKAFTTEETKNAIKDFYGDALVIVAE